MGAEDITAPYRFYELVGASLAEMCLRSRDRMGSARGREEGLSRPKRDRSDPRAWYEAMEDWRVDPEDTVDAGNCLLMIARIKPRGRGSRLPVGQRGQAVFRMREGRVLRCEEFADIHAAREAAGLVSPGR